MADRIFKGRIITTGDIHDENLRAFPEASEDFRSPHSGGLEPFQVLYNVLKGISEEWRRFDPKDLEKRWANGTPLRKPDAVETINESLWLSHEDMWIKIDPDGTIEIGISGV